MLGCECKQQTLSSGPGRTFGTLIFDLDPQALKSILRWGKFDRKVGWHGVAVEKQLEYRTIPHGLARQLIKMEFGASYLLLQGIV